MAVDAPPISATTTVSILKLPTASISYNHPFTQNQGPQPVSLTGTDNFLGGLFSAVPAGLSLNETTGAIDPSTSSAGNYTVTYSKSAISPCTDQLIATTYVTIFGLPTAAISVTGEPVCLEGAEPVVTFTGTEGQPPYTFFYNINGGATQDISTAEDESSITLNHPTLIAGTFTYTITSVTDGNNSTRVFNPGQEPTISITVSTPQIAVFTYDQEGYCQNESTDPVPGFTAGTAGTFTAVPEGLAFATGEGVAPGTIDLSASTPGTYTVTNTHEPEGGCAIITHSETVIIYPLPAAELSVDVFEICLFGESPVLTFTGSNATAPYLFSYKVNNGEPQSVSSPVGTNTATIAFPTSASGVYTVELISVQDHISCIESIHNQSVTFTINTPKIADFSYAESPYCSNGSNPFITLVEEGFSGVFSYQNSNEEEAGLAGFNTATGEITLAGSTAGTYTVFNTLAAEGGCPVIKAETSVTITQLPVAAFAYAKASYHQDESNPAPEYLEIEGFLGVAGAFSANSPFLVFATAGDPAPGTINLAASIMGTYTVTNTILEAEGCPTVTHDFEITITSPPTPPSINYAVGPGLLAYFCNSQPTATVAQDGEPGGTYTIYPVTGLNIDPNTGMLTTLDATPGAYTITYTAEGFSPATANVTIFEKATVDAGVDITICADATVQLNGSVGGSALQATDPLPLNPEWSSSGDGTFDNKNELGAIYTPGTNDIDAGSVILTLLANAPQYDMGDPSNPDNLEKNFGPCSFVTDIITITINPLPEAPIAGSVTVTYNGTSHTATATVPEGQEIIWYDAATGGNVIDDISTTLTQTSPGTYYAWAEARVEATECRSADRTQVALTIHKRDLTINAEDGSKAYGNVFEFATPGYSISSEALVSAHSMTLDLSSNGTEELANVGTYSITISNVKIKDAADIIVTDNYEITIVNGTLTVEKASLTVTANDIERGVGADTPTFTYTMTGFAGDETEEQLRAESALSGLVTFTTDDEDNGTSIGTYTITPVVTELSATNYDFIPVTGTLTISNIIVESINSDLIRKGYNTLSAAYSAINNGTHKGVITIYVYADTTEPEEGATLNPSGTGEAYYTSVEIIAKNDVIINGKVIIGDDQ